MEAGFTLAVHCQHKIHDAMIFGGGGGGGGGGEGKKRKGERKERGRWHRYLDPTSFL